MTTPSDTIKHFAQYPERWTALKDKEYTARINGGYTVDQFEAEIAKAKADTPKLSKGSSVEKTDMPLSVLSGKLGEICRERMLTINGGKGFCVAYAWLPLVAAAGMHVIPGSKPSSLFVTVVGEPKTGKTSAQDFANYLMGLDEGIVTTKSFGSAEGLLEKIGNQEGNPYLWCCDEMAHPMSKANIKGASFYHVLNSIFYKSVYETTVSGRKPIRFNAWLSIVGGTVESKFGEVFTAESQAGLYDRFLFALCPTNFKFRYPGEPSEFGQPVVSMPLPFDGAKPENAPPKKWLKCPRINPDVYAARNQLIDSEGLDERVMELCIRVAMVCAAWDGKVELRASDMEPHWELARYQMKVRKRLLPNQGLTFEAQAGEKILNYLRANQAPPEAYARNEGWHSYRDVCRRTKAYQFGATVCERAVKSLVFADEIEDTTIKGRNKWLIRAPLEDEVVAS